MEESVFELIDERTVSFWADAAAVALPLAAIGVGAAVGKRKGTRGRGAALGALIGLVGPGVRGG